MVHLDDSDLTSDSFDGGLKFILSDAILVFRALSGISLSLLHFHDLLLFFFELLQFLFDFRIVEVSDILAEEELRPLIITPVLVL